MIRPLQDQVNDIVGFAGSLMVLGFVCGMAGGMAKDWIGKVAEKEPFTMFPWLYDRFGGRKLTDAPQKERFKVAQRIAAQFNLEYGIPAKAQRHGVVEVPATYFQSNRDYVYDALDEITGQKHRRPWKKDTENDARREGEAEHHSMWLTPEQRKDLEAKYGAVATRWGEEIAPVGNLKVAEAAASAFYKKMKEAVGG